MDGVLEGNTLMMIHAIYQLSLQVPFLWWQLLLVVSLWLCVFAFFMKQRRIMICFSFLALVAGLMLAWYYYAHSLCWITVTNSAVTYGGPSKQYHQLNEVPEKTLCCMVKHDGDWACIKAPNHNKGWLPV